MPDCKSELLPDGFMDEVYNATNPLVRYVHNQRLATIVNSMPQQSSLKVLDAGCGEGHLLQKLHDKNADNEYYGIDFSPLAFPEAKKRCPYAKITSMDLTKISFESDSFDVILCTEVIEHVPNYQKALDEMTRILRPGGYLILTFPNEILWTASRLMLGRRPIKVPDHCNSFTPRKMRRLVRMPLADKKSIPFPLPFFVSLNCLMKFQKK